MELNVSGDPWWGPAFDGCRFLLWVHDKSEDKNFGILEKLSKKPSHSLSCPQIGLSLNLLQWVSIVSATSIYFPEFWKNICRIPLGYHPSSKLCACVLVESDPSDALLAVITFGPIKIHEIKYSFLWNIAEQFSFPSVLESGGQAGVTSVLLPPCVTIWVYLENRRKLGLGDIARILIQLCVISLCASL